MADDASTLEAQLREKDDIIAALTERLEQAAEQLDRIHRSGGDRGASASAGGGGGLPAELVEQQKELTEQLQQAVEQWEEMQAAATLERLEGRVLELKDLFAGGVASVSSEAAQAPAPASSGSREAPEDEPEPKRPQTSEPAPSGDNWEALKARLFASETDDSPSGNTETVEPADSVPPEANETGAEAAAPTPERCRGAADTEPDEGPEPDPPEPVDFETAGADDLRQAVERRDAYIMYLTRRIRMVQLRCTPSDGWASLENAPEELRTRLEELEGQLEQNLRHAEVEFSLERARLAREASKLQQARDQIEQEKKRLGLAGESTDDSSEKKNAEASAEQPRESGRWMRFLGKGRRGDDRNG